MTKEEYNQMTDLTQNLTVHQTGVKIFRRKFSNLSEIHRISFCSREVSEEEKVRLEKLRKLHKRCFVNTQLYLMVLQDLAYVNLQKNIS